MFLPPRPFFITLIILVSLVRKLKPKFTRHSLLSCLHRPKLSVPSDHNEVQAGDLISICYLFLLSIRFGTAIKQIIYSEGLLLPSRTNH